MGDVGYATTHPATKRRGVRGSSGKPEDPTGNIPNQPSNRSITYINSRDSPDCKMASDGGDETTGRSEESGLRPISQQHIRST